MLLVVLIQELEQWSIRRALFAPQVIEDRVSLCRIYLSLILHRLLESAFLGLNLIHNGTLQALRRILTVNQRRKDILLPAPSILEDHARLTVPASLYSTSLIREIPGR